MSTRRALRDLLEGDGLVQAPAVYDGITARLAEDAGFPALFITGNGVAASLLGSPDVGLVSMSESVAAARGIAGAVEVPVIHDGDTGYGSAVNVVRTVREVECAGLAGLTLEDQMTPKRCGVLAVPVQVTSEEEFLGKVEAAVWGRRDDLVVVARTDALRSLGMDAAVRRAQRAADCGADAVLVVGLCEPKQVEHVTAAVSAPLVVLVDESGPLSDRTPTELQAMGVRLAVYPGAVRYAVAGAARRALRALYRDGTSAAVRDGMATPEEWNALVGLADLFDIERRFVRGDGQPTVSDPDDVTG